MINVEEEDAIHLFIFELDKAGTILHRGLYEIIPWDCRALMLSDAVHQNRVSDGGEPSLAVRHEVMRSCCT